MGEVVRLDHWRASAGSRRAGAQGTKASRVISSPLPFSAASRTSEGQRCAGMPLDRQVLTVLSGTPRASATALVPPKASMAVSGVSNIGGNIVRSLRTSQEFASREATISVDYGPVGPMIDPPNVIGPRLRALRVALGYRTQKAFADSLKIEKNTYNPFETGKRELTFETACLIRRRHKIPVDYLFWGDMEDQLPSAVSRRLTAAA